MRISEISSQYQVRKLEEGDIDSVYELSVGNPLFYRYCPPYVTKESIREDMKALPPHMTYEDKYYIGFLKEQRLTAIMDLVVNYPDRSTVFIGLFMVAREEQGNGVGSAIVTELCQCVKKWGYGRIRLCYADGNRQSRSFWIKNGFLSTGEVYPCEGYTAVAMQKIL